MRNSIITFAAPNTVVLREEDISAAELKPHEVLIETLYSLISTGTELACLSGSEFWFRLPGVPGYCNLGTIVAVGEAVDKFHAGDVVLNYGRHQRFNCMPDDRMMLKPPDWMDPKLVPLTRLATVAFTALRVSDIELGDNVAVIGLGLIGNLAAQLAQLQGGRVIGIGHRETRLALARACGILITIDSEREDPGVRIKELTGGEGVRTLIDTSGDPETISDSLAWICCKGEMVLLAESRGEYQTRVADIFNRVFFWKTGTITLKGAHEWQCPILHEPFVKHSLERNSRLTWQMCLDGKLKVDNLISHVFKPEEAAAAYEALRTKKPEYLGVLFDWTA